jgi:hypothetical protein
MHPLAPPDKQWWRRWWWRWYQALHRSFFGRFESAWPVNSCKACHHFIE